MKDMFLWLSGDGFWPMSCVCLLLGSLPPSGPQVVIYLLVVTPIFVGQMIGALIRFIRWSTER